MGDTELRELERRAALGDAEAVHALDRARDRLGLGWQGEALPGDVARGDRAPLYVWRTGRGLRALLEGSSSRFRLANQGACLAPDTPFADAVRRGAVDRAIDLLRSAEERHGVAVVRSGDSCVAAGVAWPRDGRVRSVAELLDLLQDGPFWEAFDASSEEGITPLEAGENLNERVLAFLEETGLLLGGMDFTNDHVWVTRTGRVAAWSQRAWGSFLADWVSRSLRPLIEGTGLDYVPFTFHADQVVMDYASWCAAARAVIAEKTARDVDRCSRGAEPPAS